MWSMIVNCMLIQKAYADKVNMEEGCISPSFGNKQELTLENKESFPNEGH